MVGRIPLSDLFPRATDVGRVKILLLGEPRKEAGDLGYGICSLQIEHVSPAILTKQEISRRRVNPQVEEARLLAVFRRWFWTRKPDAGFLLEGFPATLLQAKVFDEWLEARRETLDAIFSDGTAPKETLEYFQNHGLPVHVLSFEP